MATQKILFIATTHSKEYNKEYSKTNKTRLSSLVWHFPWPMRSITWAVGFLCKNSDPPIILWGLGTKLIVFTHLSFGTQTWLLLSFLIRSWLVDFSLPIVIPLTLRKFWFSTHLCCCEGIACNPEAFFHEWFTHQANGPDKKNRIIN